MTFKNLKKGNRKRLVLMAGLVQSLLTISLLSTSLPNAEAAQCPSPHCYAIQSASISSLSGEKRSEVATALTTSTTCPNHNEFIDEEGWIAFANGDWIETGFTQGWLQGNCRTSDRNFYAYSSGGVYQEFDSGAATVGNTQTYEMSDTNRDAAWDVYINSANVAHFTLASSTASVVQQGEEVTYNSSTAPKTSISGIQTFNGSPPGWSNLGSGTNPYQQDSTFGLWINNCSPNYNHITVGMGGTASC
ncbi:MAG: hypothetical protein KGI19_09895 [Thaumarchaeota archaeon]|nr:hypothetical protein [Nitrososphaerota archaeon]